MADRRTRIDIESIFQLTALADYIVPFTIRVVADLGIADRLADGPRTAEELAEATGSHAPSLHRALRTLASRGVFTEVEPGRFGLTPMAAPLRSDHPLSLRGAYPLLPAAIEGWAHFDHSIRTGESAFEKAHGQSFWDFFAEHADQGVRFDGTQEAQTRLELLVVLRL